MLSFVNDDGLFIAQSKSFSFLNSLLYCSYNCASILLQKFGLTLEYSKTEIFHFSRLHRLFNPPPLDLSTLGGPILFPKEVWRYLGFIFDRKLTFCQHINFYANKAILTVKSMKIFGNSVCGLIPNQKHLLYRSCVLPIALYGFQLWFYNEAPMSYLLKVLRKIQRRAFLWILEAFKTSLSFGIKAIASLIPIHLHFQKLSGKLQLRAHALSNNHILHLLLESRQNSPSIPHQLSLKFLTKYQCKLIKGPTIDIYNRFNKVFPSFNPLKLEFAPEGRIIDSFSSLFFSIFSTDIMRIAFPLVLVNQIIWLFLLWKILLMHLSLQILVSKKIWPLPSLMFIFMTNLLSKYFTTQ